MRILHIEDEIWDSGIAHYALTLAREMKERGHEVHFWGAEASFPCEKARAAGLEVLEIKNPWLSLPALRSELKRRRIEIVNAHTGSSHSLAAALVIGLDIPLVRTRGDARPPSSHALSKALARRTRAFIAANSSIKAQLAEIHGASRIELIQQGIPAAAQVPLPEVPLIGILGRLDPVKGHEDFIVAAKEVLRSFPQARFLAAGAGSEERSSRLKAWVAKLGLANSIEFLGYVDDSSEFISRCRIGVVASVGSEAVSRAALEWMAHGRPIIATRVGCLPDMVDNEKTGYLVPAGHPGQIALALKYLLKNQEEAARLGGDAKKRFNDLFSLKHFADDTERLYEDVVRCVPS